MVDIIFMVFFGICALGLIICGGALSILALSKYSKFFMKLYLYIFEHKDYKVYKELKNFLKGGGTIPVYSSFVNTKEISWYYFIPFNGGVSLYKDNELVFCAFHKFILDELIKLDKAQEAILTTREADNEHHRILNERIAQLEKEIVENKAKLAELKKGK